MDTAQIAATIAIAAPIVIGLVELVKKTGVSRDETAPFWAIAFGEGVCALVAASDMVDDMELIRDWALVAILGLIIGLTASGLYAQVRTIAGR